jgi:hypothetical protein
LTYLPFILIICRSSHLFKIIGLFDKVIRFYPIFDLSKQKQPIMTKQQLISNATSKNFRVEFSKDKFGNDLVGVNKNNNCYHWFQVIDEYVLFNHTYSMNTGKTNKGTMHGLRVINSLNN